jgi:hypothetical protein
MEFPDPSQESGLQFLDDFLSTRSYISGYEATGNDLLVFKALKGREPADKFVNARRWFRHVQFFAAQKLEESDEKIRIAISSNDLGVKEEVNSASSKSLLLGYRILTRRHELFRPCFG